MKRALIHGLVSGLLAAAACIAWLKFYEYASYIDFSPIISYVGLIVIPVVALVIASLVYVWMEKKWSTKGVWIFHFLMSGISMASLAGPFKVHFPEGTDEMILMFVYGLFLPMHLFPALAWYTLKPILKSNN